MNGFSIRVTTVYISEATTTWLEQRDTVEAKYTPRAVP
jgi:hypothetical protein